jgi:c-di-GMP-binding flagellar brake protein YcgR
MTNQLNNFVDIVENLRKEVKELKTALHITNAEQIVSQLQDIQTQMDAIVRDMHIQKKQINDLEAKQSASYQHTKRKINYSIPMNSGTKLF